MISTHRCESDSSCEQHQVAICLHCQRRLCSGHLTEHSERVIGDAQNLSKEVQMIYRQIEEESKKCAEIFENVSTSLNHWRTDRIEQITQMHMNLAERIDSERKNFQMKQRNLFERLHCDGRQPLECGLKHETISTHLLNHIQQTVEQIREESVKLTKSLSAMNIEYPSLEYSSRTIESPLISKVRLRKITPRRELVRIFSQLSSIEDSRLSIASYIKERVSRFHLPILVCSYLTAWHRKNKIARKVLLLHKHLSTIRSYLAYDQTNIDVLVGIQAFFFRKKIQTDKENMMIYLLQFFLNHECINHSQILSWYHRKGGNGYRGFVRAKKLASSFITTLSINRTVHNSQVMSTSMDEYDIKQEIDTD